MSAALADASNFTRPWQPRSRSRDTSLSPDPQESGRKRYGQVAVPGQRAKTSIRGGCLRPLGQSTSIAIEAKSMRASSGGSGIDSTLHTGDLTAWTSPPDAGAART